MRSFFVRIRQSNVDLCVLVDKSRRMNDLGILEKSWAACVKVQFSREVRSRQAF